MPLAVGVRSANTTGVVGNIKIDGGNHAPPREVRVGEGRTSCYF